MFLSRQYSVTGARPRARWALGMRALCLGAALCSALLPGRLNAAPTYPPPLVRQARLSASNAMAIPGHARTFDSMPSPSTSPGAGMVGTPSATATTVATETPLPTITGTPPQATPRNTSPHGWQIRSVDTMKLSRDTLKAQLTDTQIRDLVRLDAALHLTHVTVDVYYDDPAYLARWVRAVRLVGLHVWFRSHWFAWENHREQGGTMRPNDYVQATRHFLQQHADLVQNGDIFDFCPEPENGAYWLQQYGAGWSWRNPKAKTAFNQFIRSGVYMAASTLANRGRSNVLVTAISVDASIAIRMLSKPTIKRLGMITLDLYPEGATRDPALATRRVLEEIATVYRRRSVPVLLGEHGYPRDFPANDTDQAQVLTVELAALAHLPYLIGLNYWVDAGGPGYGGYTNLYKRLENGWAPRPSAFVLARTFATMSHP